MGEYTLEIRRCEHIKVNGVQCASPALREKAFCYFHNQCRPKRIKLGSGEKKCSILLPAFEDANAIQFTLRQVAQMLLEEKISQKTAGLLLYTLQIAASNLREMKTEKPRPTQVVVEPEKVGDTLIGRTPWSLKGELNIDEDWWNPEARGFETSAMLWRKRWERAVGSMKWKAEGRAGDIQRCLNPVHFSASNMEMLLRNMLEEAQRELESESALAEERAPIPRNEQEGAAQGGGNESGSGLSRRRETPFDETLKERQWRRTM